MYKKATIFSAWLLICWSVYALAQVTSTMPQLGLSSASGGFTCTAAGVCSGASGTGNFVTADSTSTLTNKTFNSSGTGNSFSISGVAVSRGQIPGTNDNTAATAGNIGEYITAIAALQSISVTTSTDINVTSISLTAGDWNISGTVYYFADVTTNVTSYRTSISQTSNTMSNTVGEFSSTATGGGIVPGNNSYSTLQTPVFRVLLNSTTTIYLIARAAFSISTLTVGGNLGARRMH